MSEAPDDTRQALPAVEPVVEPAPPSAFVGDVRALDSEAVLDQITIMRATADTAEAHLLTLAVHYVDLHPVESHPVEDLTGIPGGGSVWDTSATPLPGSGALWPQAPEPVAGPGTPAVAEHAIEALGAHLNLPYAHAFNLAAEAVGLCYRLPRLWAAVHAGRVPTWKARLVARESVTLSRAAVDYVDRQLAILTARRHWPTLTKLRDLIHEAALLDDPDHEQALEEQALAQRGVWFDHHHSTASTATTSMTATLDAWDALHLDNTLSDLAVQMGHLGDTTPLDTRRATALNLLAHPQQLLDLTTSTSTPGGTHETSETQHAGNDTGSSNRDGSGSDTGSSSSSGGSGSSSGSSRSTINLYVHATLADLAAATTITDLTTTSTTNTTSGSASNASNAGSTPSDPGTYPGCALVESFGPALLAIVATWAHRADKITVRPFLDPTDCAGTWPDTDTGTDTGTGTDTDTDTDQRTGRSRGIDETATRPVDQHDPPAPMREHVILRDGACVFPGCHTDARTSDLDHITPYVPPDTGGPPGQTHPGNLAPLCRRHHRLKTHTAWHYQRNPDGTYTWTTPTGRTYTTHPQPHRSSRGTPR